MSTPRCCEGTSTSSRTRRGLSTAAGTVGPAAVMALLPKCPACIAAYLAMGAGMGVTVSTAAHLRMAILVLCVACAAFVTARHLRRKAA